MTSTDILSDLSIVRNRYSLLHASKLLAIYNLLKTMKNDVLKVDVCDSICKFGEKTEKRIDYRGNRTIKQLCNGFEIPGKSFTISTKNGEYSVNCPINCNLYTMFCSILKVYNGVNEQIKETIEVSSLIIDKIKKATLYIGTEKTYQINVLNNVLLDFSGNSVNVVGCDNSRLYVSENLSANGANKKLIICAESLGIISKIKPEKDTIKIAIIDENNAIIDGVKIKLYTNNEYVDYKIYTNKYLEGMIFNRRKLLDSITDISNMIKPETGKISLYLNGTIKISAKNDSEKRAEIMANYEIKTFDDMNISFNYNYLKTCLKTFKSDNLEMLSNNDSTKAVIFTDSKDFALLMPMV